MAMVNYGKIKGSVYPNEIEMTTNKVFVASDIEEYTETIDEREVSGYQYDYKEYTKDEYILLMAQNNADVAALREELEAAKILLGVE